MIKDADSARAWRTYRAAMRRHARRARKLGMFSTEIGLLAHVELAPTDDWFRLVVDHCRRGGSGGVYDPPGTHRTAAFLWERAAEAVERLQRALEGE